MSARIDPKTPLKPCPFCGCMPKLSLGKIAPGFFQIECVSSQNKCPAYLYVIGLTEEEATERWNTRFISTP